MRDGAADEEEEEDGGDGDVEVDGGRASESGRCRSIWRTFILRRLWGSSLLDVLTCR